MVCEYFFSRIEVFETKQNMKRSSELFVKLKNEHVLLKEQTSNKEEEFVKRYND